MSAQIGGEDEALIESVLPPSLSPAPRSCAEILTSNHKDEVNILPAAPTEKPSLAIRAVADRAIAQHKRPMLDQMIDSGLQGAHEAYNKRQKK